MLVVAVGTALTGGPPHRSGHAALPHPALTSGVWRRSAHSDSQVGSWAGESSGPRAMLIYRGTVRITPRSQGCSAAPGNGKGCFLRTQMVINARSPSHRASEGRHPRRRGTWPLPLPRIGPRGGDPARATGPCGRCGRSMPAPRSTAAPSSSPSPTRNCEAWDRPEPEGTRR